VKIDVTKNEDLTDKAGITKLPTVFIYKKGEKIKGTYLYNFYLYYFAIIFINFLKNLEIEGALDAENLKESIKPFLTQ